MVLAKFFFSPCAAAGAVSSSSLLLVTLLLISASLPEQAAAASGARRRYGSIFSFGDSYADTGNNPVAFRRRSLFDPVARPPYGVTFFGRPTGRECDGRLVIDFIAESLGLPLVPPFLNGDGNFFRRGGANFAVGGATALDASFFHRDDPPGGGSAFPLNTSLAVQLQWFEESIVNDNKPSSSSSSLRARGSGNDTSSSTAANTGSFIGTTSLFFVGAFGVNDYLLSLDKKSVPRVRSLVPDVIETISTAIERVITHGGARNLVVPGIIPLGCTPPVIVMYADRDPAGHDPKTGCLKGVNELVTHHNTLLREAVRDARAKHPGVNIVYADFFGPVMEMLTSPSKFGFQDVFTLCCGGPGKYNYNPKIFCGDAGAVTCKDPSTRVFWDGVHLTEAAYRHVAADWLTTINNGGN